MDNNERERALARLDRGFMRPHIDHCDVWEVRANHGETYYVPADIVGTNPANLADYIDGVIDTDDDGEPIAELLRDKWIARLSAPGFLDCSAPSVYARWACSIGYHRSIVALS